MQKHIELTRQRVQNFSAKLAALFYAQRAPATLAVYAAPGRITYQEAMLGEYRPAFVGEKFGPLWSTHWFKVNLKIPAGWRGQEVHLLWDSASEACLWQAGAPLQGLTGSFNGWQAEPIRKEFCLTKNAQGDETLEYFIEAACNGLFGVDNQAHNPRIGELSQAEMAVFDRQAWDLYWDFKIIADLALHLPANTPRGGQALYAANEMVNATLLEDKSTWPAARQIATRFLAARNGDGQHNLSAVGHAHIDTAWLWPLAETKRKSARSFASATRYMDEYPEYIFACSQAQQFEWMKEHYPALYTRIAEKVRSGQFVPAGGTWVEPDCNIPSGESLVRQFLYGQRFFEAEFGLRCQEFWNPDVFGYSGALPQIMKLAGIDYFLTQKLSWNQFNKPASHTFLWEGIDGSQVLTHFPPADTYNSLANVKEVLYNVSNFKDHERANESYLLFGFGDGGGGPTTAMLEQLRRMTDVDGLPRTQIRAPREFFARCAADLKDPLVMVGELYFELHRGTYTSQARNKKFNRQSEFLLRDVEMLSTLALVTRGLTYPANALQKLWKLVLTNQFHDIIPGSSIGEVYADSAKDYTTVLEQAATLHGKAIQALTPETSTPETDKVFVFNTLSFPRTEVVDLGGRLGLVSAPSLGYAIQTPATTTETVSVTETKTGFILENTILKAVFNRQGGLTSLFDKSAQRESIEPGQAGNTFVLYEDLPNAWEAWDVDAFHLEKKLVMGDAISAKIAESGPLRAAITFEYIISPHSTIRQVVSLDALSARLDFACQVDWQEKQKFLKVEFPLNLRASYATYEIQFGHVQRPTHFNTSYDMARFEVPAHKWADLSEPDYGVALLNDCKYGYAAHGNILRLSLLRAPTYPDPGADQGQHQFRFALYPHAGSPQSAGVTEAAWCFNVPLLTAKTAGQDIQQTFFSLDQPAVLLDTIKKAEDSEALILRLYEARGTRGKLRLASPLPVRSAALVNLLEGEISQLNWQDGGVELSFKPFEIISMRLTL
ncbi:MAG: alpha-mannosidase [Chloroflexi bacterium HGW-Chloroflexi-6]|nr:MAG: alpha-mannosidase [Chloroflexi bacterium HGW-Chloroflexi-6]